jgi:hypothetical protein
MKDVVVPVSINTLYEIRFRSECSTQASPPFFVVYLCITPVRFRASHLCKVTLEYDALIEPVVEDLGLHPGSDEETKSRLWFGEQFTIII